jgi:hypothetical protein
VKISLAKKARKAEVFRAKKSFKYQALLVVFFALIFFSARVNAEVLINEVMFDPAGTDGATEWVELYNTTAETENLDNWDLDPDTGSYVSLTGKKIAGKDFLVITGLSGMRNDKGQVSLYKSHTHSKDSIVDYVQYGSFDLGAVENVPKTRALDAKIWKDNDFVKIFSEGYSLERTIDGKDSNEVQDWQKSFESGGTKGATNSKPKQQESVLPIEYSDKIQLNEILPYPQDGAEEYIELFNAGPKQDLIDWTLRDGSKTGVYKFAGHEIIESKDYLVLYKSDFGFALNNSGAEKVLLFDGEGKLVFEVAYSGSKKGISYNFNGSAWHWSKFLTPGKENIFEDVSAGELDFDRKVFANVYANFAILGLDKKAKVTWDFGDGHKSYLQKTRHKYQKEGKYQVSIKYAKGSEDVVENFEIEVGEIAHPKIRIVAISANPEGVDAGKEFLTVENKTKKKINLNGWSIATGWKKKMINHPIKKELVIKAGKSKNLTNEFASFALNNTKAIVQLRYPDGKVAHEIKYKKPEGIADNEKRIKIKGGWLWSGAADRQAKKLESLSKDEVAAAVLLPVQDLAEISSSLPQPIGSEQILEIKNILKPTVMVGNIEIANSESKIFAVKIERESSEQYFFSKQTAPQRHYLRILWENFSEKVNEKINWFLNF